MCEQVTVLSFINTFSTVGFYERFIFHSGLFFVVFFFLFFFFCFFFFGGGGVFLLLSSQFCATYFHVIFIHFRVKPELIIKHMIITMITSIIILVAHLWFGISIKGS